MAPEINSPAWAGRAFGKCRQGSAKVRSYDEELIRIKTEVEEKSKAFAGRVAQLKAEFSEEQKTHADEIADIKAKYEQQLTGIKAEADEAVAVENDAYNQYEIYVYTWLQGL